MKNRKKLLIIIPILLLIVIIFMFMNASSLKKLFADINSLSMGMTTFKDWSESPTTLDSKYSNSTIFLTKDSSFEVYRNKDGEVKKYMCDYSKFNGSDTYTTEAEEYMKNSNYKFLIQWSKIDVTENGDTYTFCLPRVEIDLLDGETYQNLDNDVELTEGFSILAKNSAINANGNYIDAVLTTKNLVFWNNKELDAKYVYKSRITTLSLEGITSGQYSRLDSEGSSQVPVVLGIPIEFNLDHMIGQVDASLSYYEADTYNTPNQKYADVKNIIGLYSDIDVWNDKTDLFSDKIFKGNEGVAFTNSENVKTIYYDVDGQYGKQIQLTNKDGSKTATNYQARLKTVTAIDENNKEYSGLYIDDEVRTNANVKDIHEKTSIFITEDLDNEKIFNFRYASARSAGIRFCFVSPIKYDIAGPVKTSSVTKTTDNKNYIYSIIQKIPNNYYGYALKFANYSGTLYNSISISDTFDEKLTNIDKNKITIVNENGLDVTKYFDISLSEVNGKIKLVATISNSNSDNFISKVDFYNHTYKVNVPVTTKDKINKNKISNKASTTVDNDTSNILESNNVDVDVYYTVTINHIDEYNNAILKTTTDEVIYGNTFSSNKEDFENYEYDYNESDTNDGKNSGVVNKNITVNYYYKKKATVTVNYYKEGTTEKLADSDTLNKYYGDTYDVTSYKDNNNVPSKYEYTRFTSNTTDELAGTVYIDEIRINYYYKLKDAKIVINYLEDKTNSKLAESTVINTKYDNKYDVTSYKNNSNISSKYEYIRFESNPSDALTGTVNQDTVTINYYYKLKKSKIIINYYKEGTTEKLADTTTLNQTYDDKYDVTSYKDNKSISMDYRYVSYTSTPENALSGIVSKDTITVNYYYALKEATINIKYLDELTNENILNEENINTKYGVLYNTLNLDSYKKEIKGYDYSKTETTPRDITGKVNQDTTTIIHYYKKKASITINYIDKYTNAKISGISSDVINNHYGDSYNTENNRTEKEKNTIFNDYDYANEYVITPENTSLNGTISTDNIVVNYYYNKKSNITIKYYDIETKKEIAKENVDNKVHFGDVYNVEAKKIETEKEEIFKNYNFESYDSNSKQSNDLKQIKIDNENVTVNLYYRLKTSTITIKYLEETTNKELAETYIKSMKYTEVYNATEIRDKAGVPKNYNLVRHESSTGVLSGTISEPSILIIFYYEKKDPKLETSVSKTGTKEITRKDAEVGYKLNYKAVIKDYIGNAKVTYIDKLPYEIDEEKSDISGGKYNKETKTIVWEETYDKINMEKEITFTKEIKVVYIGIEDTDRIMTNEIETTIKLDNKESTVTSDYDTGIKIPGEIVIHYYDKETKEKLAKDIEKTDLIGNQYVSEEKEFEGYKLVSKPESNVHIYKEKKQEFSYEYEKIKFKITTKVEGEGGTIEGDEIVKYGEDSSKDKIKIKAKEGYEINKITINGESYEITDRNEIIMPYFKEVKEDKEIIVSFVKKIENPKTLDNIMSYIGYAVLSIIGLVISGIVLIKNKTQEKI
ncbi:MAG TPA: hypothetical protein DHV70_05545 [Firmicutes bacterium]|nr:hypothetical protein [Bacillota bacterium]